LLVSLGVFSAKAPAMEEPYETTITAASNGRPMKVWVQPR
jgi:hypothetical protein